MRSGSSCTAGSTLRERELLHHFLAEQRRGADAVVAINEDVVIAGGAEARLSFDHHELWGPGRSRCARRRRGWVRAGARRRWRRRARARDRARWVHRRARDRRRAARARRPGKPLKRADVRGEPAIVRVSRDASPGRELPGLLQSESANGCDRVLVTGEAGVGKRTLRAPSEAFAKAPSAPWTELDCVASEEIGEAGRCLIRPARRWVGYQGRRCRRAVATWVLNALAVPERSDRFSTR